MPRIKIIWTPQAKLDLREIRQYIARNAPRTATEYVQRLRKAVGLLRKFPELGSPVPERGFESHRELIKGNYRIIYYLLERTVFIVAVRHAARLWGKEFLDE